jgi:sugar-specific transcriptional regulator TrmB
LSLERVIKILENSGFASSEAKVYVYLAKGGTQTVKEITLGLGMPKRKLIPILCILREKGIVVSCSKKRTQFSALSIEKVLDIQVAKTVNQAKSIKDAKEELIANWQKMDTQNYA